MRKFKKLGFIDYVGKASSDLTINKSLLRVAAHDLPDEDLTVLPQNFVHKIA